MSTAASLQFKYLYYEPVLYFLVIGLEYFKKVDHVYCTYIYLGLTLFIFLKYIHFMGTVIRKLCNFIVNILETYEKLHPKEKIN